MAMRERLPVVSVAAEMIYDARDPFHPQGGDRQGRHAQRQGGPGGDRSAGVMGRSRACFRSSPRCRCSPTATRPFRCRWCATDCVPSPSACRGGADGGAMEIKFLATNADVRQGDTLVTSGIDGTYLPGLPVATVVRIEREAGYAFARIVCKPAAGVDRAGQVLVSRRTAFTPAAPPPPEGRQARQGTQEAPACGSRRCQGRRRQGCRCESHGHEGGPHLPHRQPPRAPQPSPDRDPPCPHPVSPKSTSCCR